MRIVSLACSNTEIVWALGCGDMLVGVDEHSDFPEELVGPLPKVGPDLDIDVDRVVALKPDLVLATLTVPGHEKIVAKLEAAGLPFIAPEPVSLEDVFRDIGDIAARLGVPERGTQLVSEMRAELGLDASAGEPDRADHADHAGQADHADQADHGDPTSDTDRPSILVQWWPKPVISPGAKSWITDLIELAGGRNPIGRDPVKSRPIPDEEVAALCPDVVAISWCGVNPAKYRPDVVYNNPAFAEVSAIRANRVICIPEAFMGRPGPRLVDGFRALKEAVELARKIN